jgi:multidrug transporter EmrE-like cation transporter
VGIWFAGEHVTGMELIALTVILAGVFLVLSATQQSTS